MRALRSVVAGSSRRVRATRLLAAPVVVTAAALTLAGCAKFDAALGQRLAIVDFRPGTPQSTMMRIRSACARLPGVRPLPVPSGLNSTTGLYDVQYRIDNATDADVAKLEQCLSRYPVVQGIQLNNPGEEGN